MRTISVWICLLTLTATFASRATAQDAATQEALDKISGQIQDVQDSLTAQDKRITAVEKKIADMQDQVKSTSGNDYASADDLKKLAEQVQEIDKKRQEDNQKILDAIKQIAKGGKLHAPPPDTGATATPTTPVDTTQTPTAGAGPANQNGYPYEIQAGNTLSAIAKAYRAKGVKVTVDDILKANPGLNPNSLIVGQKIFIPAGQ
jgi:LysM repeat protein